MTDTREDVAPMSAPVEAYPIVHADTEATTPSPPNPFNPLTPTVSQPAASYPIEDPRPENYKFYDGDGPRHDETADEFGPVSEASAADSKKRLAEGTLFRHGIVSYRIPEWDPGHISRGVKYFYVTDAMTSAMPPIPSYRDELSKAVAAGVAQPLKADGSNAEPDKSVKAPSAEEIAEAVAYLIQAKERMAVNSLSDVGFYIGRAIQLLEG